MDKINNIGLARELLKVYDFDGFTPQEVWSRIAQKMNIIIEHFNYLDKKFDNQKELVDSKLNYLLNEGLTEQVSKKIIALVNDGTLGELINGTLLKEINDKVDTFKNEINEQLDNIDKKIKKIEINITDYGAIGDDKTDNTEAFARAINILKENNGGTLIIPFGIFQTSPFSLPDNVVLRGYGDNSVIKCKDKNGDFYTLVSVARRRNIIIKNLTIDINRENNGGKIYRTGIAGVQAQINIYLLNSEKIIIENVNLISCGVWAITMDSTNEKPINRDIIIRDNIIHWTQGNSDYQEGFPTTSQQKFDATSIFIDAENYQCYNNTIISTDGLLMTGIECHTSYGDCYNNYIENTNNGILIVPNHWEISTGYLADKDLLINCYDNKIVNVNTGIRLWNMPTRELRKVKVHNNTIYLNPQKRKSVACMGISNLIQTSQSKAIKDVVISDNLIKYYDDNTTYGDSDHNTNFVGICFGFRTPLSNITIKGNTIINSPSTGICFLSYDSIESTGINISDNTIIDCGNNPNLVTADHNPKCAIRISNYIKATVGENTIIDNSSSIKLTKLYHFNNISNIDYKSPLVNAIDLLKNSRKVEFSPQFAFDSQTGSFTITNNNSYYKRCGEEIEIYFDFTIESFSVTQSYTMYFKSPFKYIDNKNEFFPLLNHEKVILSSDSRGITLRTTPNSNAIYFMVYSPNNTQGSISYNNINVGTRFVGRVKYNINYSTSNITDIKPKY